MHSQLRFQTQARFGIPPAICSAYLTGELSTLNPFIIWLEMICFPKLPFMTLDLFPNQAAVPDPSPGGENACVCLHSVNLVLIVLYLQSLNLTGFLFSCGFCVRSSLDTLMHQGAPLD